MPPSTAFIVPRAESGAPTAWVPLAPILDNVSRTRAMFRVGNVVVHVYGLKSRNKGDWFIAFAPEGGDVSCATAAR